MCIMFLEIIWHTAILYLFAQSVCSLNNNMQKMSIVHRWTFDLNKVGAMFGISPYTDFVVEGVAWRCFLRRHLDHLQICVMANKSEREKCSFTLVKGNYIFTTPEQPDIDGIHTMMLWSLLETKWTMNGWFLIHQYHKSCTFRTSDARNFCQHGRLR